MAPTAPPDFRGSRFPGGPMAGPPAGVPSVGDSNDQNEELFVADFVYHAMIAYA